MPIERLQLHNLYHYVFQGVSSCMVTVQGIVVNEPTTEKRKTVSVYSGVVFFFFLDNRRVREMYP